MRALPASSRGRAAYGLGGRQRSGRGVDRGRSADRLAAPAALAAAGRRPVRPAVGGDDFIATDLVSAPLLWVAPLAIYLASFIVAFSPRGARLDRAARSIAAPAMVTLLWVPYGSAGGWPILAVLAMELVAFGVVAIALHGRLAQDRPDPSHLTEFYLILSLGGALASAPSSRSSRRTLFPDVWEYPILLVGALVALGARRADARAPRHARAVVSTSARSSPGSAAGCCRTSRSAPRCSSALVVTGALGDRGRHPLARWSAA